MAQEFLGVLLYKDIQLNGTEENGEKMGYDILGIISVGVIIYAFLQICKLIFKKLKVIKQVHEEKLEKERRELELKLYAQSRKNKRRRNKKNARNRGNIIKEIGRNIFTSLRSKIDVGRKNIKVLSSVIAVFVIILTLLMGNNRFILFSQRCNDVLLPIFCIISLLIILAFIIYLVYYAKQIQDKVLGIYLGFIFLSSFGVYLLKIGSSVEPGIEVTLVVAFLMFYFVVYVMFMIISKRYNTIASIVLSLCLYILLIIVGSFYFGAYYINHFQSEFVKEIEQLNRYMETNDMNTAFWIVVKSGIRCFYTFPGQGILSGISIFQFLLGKITDFVMFGYIISNLRPSRLQKNN